MVGTFNGEKLTLDTLNRFDNGYIQVLDHIYWNILGLFNQIKLSLVKSANLFNDSLVGIGIDSWGLDFGLLDNQGDLIGNPYCYRDPQTNGMIQEAFKRVSKQEIFETTGLQFMQINTLYHLLAMVISDSSKISIANKFLMIPDLINYWLTGRGVCEYTNASNTQLMNVRTKEWAFSLIQAMGIPTYIFPEILEAGEILEQVRPSILEETGLQPLPVIATVTADTGAAVASVPAKTNNFAYLSSGTWGLMGVELTEPMLTDKVQQHNFGNEGGVFDTIRLLRNIPNLWFVQECRRIWSLEGQSHSWAELIQMAEAAKPFLAYFDPDEPQFLLPDHMPRTIQDYCAKSGQNIPQDKGEIIRVCLESLALKYRHTIDKLTDILGKTPKAFHIVGGGGQNKMLCQFAASACKIPVIVGPYEATALGNIMVQMIALGDIKDHAEGRTLIDRSFPTEEYLPKDLGEWEEQYQRYLEITRLPNILLSN